MNPSGNPAPIPSCRPYVAPMAIFMALTALESYAPRSFYLAFYAVKVVLVTAALLWFRAPLRDIRFEPRVLPLAVLIGLVVFAEWIIIDKWIPYPHLGTRVGLNPFAAFPEPALRTLFFALRFYGLVLMVPLMEEIFWRSFLLRYLTAADFTALPVGSFSAQAFALVAGAFALAHPEWLVALLAACLYGWLLRQTRSLFACIVAHAVTNLALGIYVVNTRDWAYW